MVDVDHFKIYNDTHGHPEGDAVLKEVSALMSAGLRGGDLAARYGGEEFAIVFDGANKEAACVAAERIRRAIADHSFAKGSVTVSMGVAEFPVDTSDSGELIELADKALYHAKSIGRNRVFGWGATSSCVTPDEAQDAPGLTGLALLVVEPADEHCASELAESIGDNCTVTSGEDITEAQEQLKSRAFDVTIVSSSVLLEIRQIADIASIHPHMPVILVADGLSAAESRLALRKGASDIICRPYNPAAMPLLIERNLERQHLVMQKLMQKGTGVMLQAIDALVAAVDAKDHHTAGHSHKVTELTMALSDMLGISDEERYALELASKLHDIGKLALPETALNKHDLLTEEEWRAMREHPVIGAKIVGTISELAYVSTVIRHHHERLDGSGYPDGLSGDAIPYLSRIIAVADTYEAMTSARAHRQPMMPAQAMAELQSQAGTLYEAAIVDVLERQLREQGDIPAHTPIAKAA